MSDEFDEGLQSTYRLAELEDLSPEDLRALIIQAVGELRDLKVEYEEF